MSDLDAFTWSNSRLREIRSCEKKFAYHYVEGLEPTHGSYAMERGSWVHHCLAAEHLRKGIEEDTLLIVPDEFDLRVPGMDLVALDPSGFEMIVNPGDDQHRYPLSAKGMLMLLTEQVWELLPEEMREDEDLPAEVGNLVDRYLTHYPMDYEVLLVEHRWHRQSDKGVWLTGAIDLVKRTPNGLVVCTDHKTHASLPDAMYRLTDSQLHLYGWGVAPTLEEHGVELDAVEFDYIVTASPVEVKWTKPTKKKPSRLYKTVTDSQKLDVYTLQRGIEEKRAELDALDPEERYAVDFDSAEEFLDELREREANHHPFFSRALMPLNHHVTSSLLEEHHITVARGRALLKGDTPRRSVDFFECRRCPYAEVCSGDLYGNDTTPHREQFAEAEWPTLPEEYT